MISIDEFGKINRYDEESSSSAARKRMELAERLRVGVYFENTIFESCENSDPRLLVIVNYTLRSVALALLDKGVLKFNWGRYQYYVSDSFNTESPVEDIKKQCNDIISVLTSLDHAFEGSTLFNFDSDISVQKIISWEKVSNWVLKCPIKYSSSAPALKV